MIREYTLGGKEKAESFAAKIPEIASQTSTLERRAIDAERVVEAMKKAEYMEEHVGEEFDAVVASVVKFGLFVELPNTIEGLIHITTLPEFYHYNERTMSLHGEKSGKVFKVGQQIRVKLTRADKETGDIDFEYLPSDFDVVEKVPKDKKDKKDRKGRKPRQSKEAHASSRKKGQGDKRGKNKKPFYKDAARKKQKRKR